MIGQKAVISYLGFSMDEDRIEEKKRDILSYTKKRKLGETVFVEEDTSIDKDWKERRINKIIEKMNVDDSLIVQRLSCLGRSTVEVLEILKKIVDNKIRLFSIKEGSFSTGIYQSEEMSKMISLVTDLEREFRSESIKQALFARKKKGLKLGRPKGPGKSKLDKHRNQIIHLLKNGSTKVFIARRFDTTLPNLYNWLKSNSIEVTPRPKINLRTK